jgi:hypothetical protein
MAMTKEEKITAISALLKQYVTERVKDLSSSGAFRAFEVDSGWDDFLQQWLEDYRGEAKVPHYVVRELVKHLESVVKPYNIPYVRTIEESDWVGEAPGFTITIPATVHNLLGSIEVNVYAITDGVYELVECEVSIDGDKRITIGSATKFEGKIEVFSSTGEMPDLYGRRPVFSVNDLPPDTEGNVQVDVVESVINQRDNISLKFWIGTEDEYKNLPVKDPQTVYLYH